MQNPAISDENTLGPYRLIRKLGQGGMGAVYLGHDDALMRHVAIKVLRLSAEMPDRAQAALVKRFMREAQSTARLNHPNVVTIYNVFQQGERPFIAMEYVEGGSLADQLHRKGPMPWREATQAMSDALHGLTAAHEAGVIHRDIKPANLMRAKNGAIKLVDFGLARVLEGPADGELTFPGAFVGSPSYASPEQAAGAMKIDGRSDLYSLAATWYALLTGQPPFVHDDPAEIMRLHLTEAFPDVREFVPDAPAELMTIMHRASRKHADERYPDANAMRAAIEKLLSSTFSSTRAADPIPSRAVRTPVRAEQSVIELESRLVDARSRADSQTQLAALRSLYGFYSQLDRRDDALRAFREAMVLHVRMHEPPANRKMCV